MNSDSSGCPNLVRLALNGRNLWLFQIKFQYILAHRLKRSRICPISANLTHFRRVKMYSNIMIWKKVMDLSHLGPKWHNFAQLCHPYPAVTVCIVLVRPLTRDPSRRARHVYNVLTPVTAGYWLNLTCNDKLVMLASLWKLYSYKPTSYSVARIVCN